MPGINQSMTEDDLQSQINAERELQQVKRSWLEHWNFLRGIRQKNIFLEKFKNYVSKSNFWNSYIFFWHHNWWIGEFYKRIRFEFCCSVFCRLSSFGRLNFKKKIYFNLHKEGKKKESSFNGQDFEHIQFFMSFVRLIKKWSTTK